MVGRRRVHPRGPARAWAELPLFDRAETPPPDGRGHTRVVLSFRQPKQLQHLHSRVCFVQRIEMDSRGAILKEIGALTRRILDPELRDGGVILAELIELRAQLCGNARAT